MRLLRGRKEGRKQFYSRQFDAGILGIFAVIRDSGSLTVKICFT